MATFASCGCQVSDFAILTCAAHAEANAEFDTCRREHSECPHEGQPHLYW